MASPLSKKPKLNAPASEQSPVQHANGDRVARQQARDEACEEEQGLMALVEHRGKEVVTIKQKLAHYQSMLEEAEKRLSESKSKLSLIKSRNKNQNLSDSNSNLKLRSQPVIPAKASKANPHHPSSSSSGQSNSADAMSEKRKQEKQPKRKIEEEHQDLIPSVKRSSKPIILEFGNTIIIPSDHKRKMRCLELCPTNDNLFVTSALDGLIKFWQVNAKMPSASLLSTTDCLSPKQRRWPEAIAWHPDGDTIVSVYSGDAGDCQISILDLNKSNEKKVSYLEAKPHNKGLINSVTFTPWEDNVCFLTGGSDHSVILWREEGDGKFSYKHKSVHRDMHSSAVMGLSALKHKRIVLSVGADKRIIGFDLLAGRSDFRHQIEYKCMSVLPNPCDFNLYLVQSGAPGQQLGLYDLRLRRTEIHSFGWKQVSSDSQSALINQSWYQGRGPSQSVQAHQKRVFKAMWHQSLPVLSSISSDLNIGLHKVY
ncbi:U5 small nuclear ribonucleoprotein [Carex littledalei]|uniref:U5 small nuclear ribonucleoprotein n=1 Tax=Carex littledalei TaxID=544730 RepID=A0A833RVZ7_9POAL|nr:U5 small nuclear ribonucleoprotein [Carex littledalei]